MFGAELLSAILASGSTPPAFSFPISFAGPAGTTPAQAANTAGLTVDGNGNLILPKSNYGSSFFTAPGSLGDGSIDFVFAGNTPSRAVNILLRGNCSSGNFYDVIFGGSGDVIFGVVTNGNFASIGTATGGAGNGTVPNNASSVGITLNGSTFTLRINGANTGTTWTDASFTSGFIGVAVQQDFSAQVTTINSTQHSA